MTRSERIDRMANDAERALQDASNVSIHPMNYGLHLGPGLLKNLRAYGFDVRPGGIGYVEFRREKEHHEEKGR